jgi:hypothetical protein
MTEHEKPLPSPPPLSSPPYMLGNWFSQKILTNLALHVMFYYKFPNLTTKGEALCIGATLLP